MPVMVMYKDKSVTDAASTDIMQALSAATRELLDSASEIRVIEPLTARNANIVHIEIRFRDFGDWPDKLLADYHESLMARIKQVFETHHMRGQFSVYILPSLPPRSIWSQTKV